MREGGLSIVGGKAQITAVHLEDRGVIGIAQARCGLHQRIKYFLHVERRSADDLEHIGGGRLLFEGFRQLALARLFSLKQSRVKRDSVGNGPGSDRDGPTRRDKAPRS
jgi:hypothetical protein